MPMKDDVGPRFTYEILNPRGTVFLKSARPRPIEEIQADSTLKYMMSQYRHRAWDAHGREVDALPGFKQPVEQGGA